MIKALSDIIDEMILALGPLVDATQDSQMLSGLLAKLGWTPNSVPRPLIELASAGSDLVNIIGSDPGEVSPEQAIDSVKRLVDAINAIRTLPDTDFPSGIDIAAFKATIGRDLLDYLLVDYLLLSRPKVGGLLKLAGLIRLVQAPAAGLRQSYLKREVEWNQIGDLLTDPVKGFREAYDWNSSIPQLTQILGELGSLLEAYGLEYAYFIPKDDLLTFVNAGALTPLEEQAAIDLALASTFETPDGINAGIQLLLRPPTANRGEAISLLPYARLIGEQVVTLSDTLSLTNKGNADFTKGLALTFAPGQTPELEAGFLGEMTTSPAEIQIGLRATPLLNEPERVLIGTSDASRLAIKSVTLSAGARLISSDKLDAFIVLTLENAHVVIKPAPGETDSFLLDFLGPDGLSGQFSFALRLSSLTGFHFEGSGGLEASFPLHLTIGPIDFQSLSIGLKPGVQAADLEVGATLAGNLGPLTAIVDGMGFKLAAKFPDTPTGNLGPVDLGFGFKPPEGVGLSIDGNGFSGGGFLKHYEDDGRYEGILELEYEDKISLKAIGLITTKLPGGKDGFSLVIIITAEFTPIQLGLGFTLNGVGGMLGYNRTADVERLRSGVRDDSLSSVLFPQNIVENASRILSDLNQLFPVQEGRFIFGPMARIGWGSPTRITIDLGLMIEVPSPVRVLILGVIRAVLPDEKAKLLHLQVNFLGVIDFGAQKLSFDASLFDSKLLGFTLSGDMAVRMNWGHEPNFLLTVGGFHPQYQPPPLNLPTLRRLTLQLTTGNNPRLTLEMYFAVTSNSVQFGAKLELFAGSMSSFAVSGFLSFDVLFQFNPFYFIASIQAKVALLAGGSEIASVSLDFTLEGPTPWHVKGKARLKICWFLTITVPFDATFGEERNTRLDDIAVIPLLKAELSRPESWEAQLLSGHPALVSTKKVEVQEGDVVASPFGVFTVQEKTVPLGMTIQQVGSQKPTDGSQFAISRVLVEGEALSQSDVYDQFAPAQFFEMSDSDKLSSKKAFEAYPSGVKLDDSQLLSMAYGVTRVVDYELSYLDKQREHLPKPGPVHPDVQSFHSWALGGAVAASPLSQAHKAPSALAPGKVQLQRELFVVVNASDLTPVETAIPTTQAQAQLHLQQLLYTNPAQPDLLVIPQFEVNSL